MDKDQDDALAVEQSQVGKCEDCGSWLDLNGICNECVKYWHDFDEA